MQWRKSKFKKYNALKPDCGDSKLNKGLLSARVNLGKTQNRELPHRIPTTSPKASACNDIINNPSGIVARSLRSLRDHDEAKAQRRRRTLQPLLHVNPNGDKQLWPIYTVHWPTCPPGFKIVMGHFNKPCEQCQSLSTYSCEWPHHKEAGAPQD